MNSIPVLQWSTDNKIEWVAYINEHQFYSIKPTLLNGARMEFQLRLNDWRTLEAELIAVTPGVQEAQDYAREHVGDSA